MKKLLGLVVAVALAAFAISAFAQTAVVQSQNNIFNKGQTYSATTNFTAAATPTDVFVLRGSATKTLYVKELTVSCVRSTAGYGLLNLVKRTAANEAGTSVAVTAVPHDSANGTVTATVFHYTANPTTLGTGTNLRTLYIPMPTSGTIIENKPTLSLWGTSMDQYITLRGIAQELTVNFGGATVTGAQCGIATTWIEK